MITAAARLGFCFSLAFLLSTAVFAEETQDVNVGDLNLRIPTSWTKQEPSNRLRLAQFEIPPVEGDEEAAELVIFPPFGGTVGENVKRWIDQFHKDDREVKMSKGTVEQGDYVLIDVTGTYHKPDGPPIRRKTIDTPDYRVISVMLTTKEHGNYFLRLVGPKATVAGAVDQFRASFGADKGRESEYKLE